MASVIVLLFALIVEGQGTCIRAVGSHATNPEQAPSSNSSWSPAEQPNKRERAPCWTWAFSVKHAGRASEGASVRTATNSANMSGRNVAKRQTENVMKPIANLRTNPISHRIKVLKPSRKSNDTFHEDTRGNETTGSIASDMFGIWKAAAKKAWDVASQLLEGELTANNRTLVLLHKAADAKFAEHGLRGRREALGNGTGKAQAKHKNTENVVLAQLIKPDMQTQQDMPLDVIAQESQAAGVADKRTFESGANAHKQLSRLPGSHAAVIGVQLTTGLGLWTGLGLQLSPGQA